MQSQRIAGLDLWRALLMMGGLLLHGSVLQPPTTAFALIDMVSGSFRMGAFFIISGLLAGFSMEKQPLDHWLRIRLLQIGVPTVFALLVLCPALDLLLHWARGPKWPSGGWYHIWFLVALLTYAGLGYALERIDRRHRVFAQIDAYAAAPAFRPWVALVGLAMLVLLLILGTLRIMDAAHLFAGRIWLTQTRLILGYAPLYLFGIAMARAPRFRLAMLAAPRTPLLLLAVAAIVHLLCYLGGHEGAQPAGMLTDLRLFASAFVPAPVTLLIIRSAMTIERVPAWLNRLSAASFTMYLLHVPALYAVNLVVAPLPLNIYAEYALSVLVVGTGSYLFHAHLVARSPVLRFVMNGRLRSSAPPVRGDADRAASGPTRALVD